MKTKVELLEEIVKKQDELIKSFGNCNCDICEKVNSDLASLKSQLAEKVYDLVKDEEVALKSLKTAVKKIDNNKKSR